jgi:hypothetical protein
MHEVLFVSQNKDWHIGHLFLLQELAQLITFHPKIQQNPIFNYSLQGHNFAPLLALQPQEN